jgi:hypothetical protein
VKSPLLLFSLMTLTISGGAWAQSTLSTKVSSKPRTLEQIKAWSLDFQYGLKTDLATESDRRSYENAFGASYSYHFLKDWNASVGTGLVAEAEGNNIRREEDNPFWQDISIGVGWSHSVFSESRWLVNLTEALPTGYDSQMEGTRSIVTSETQLQSPFFKRRLTLINSLSASHLFQTYDTSSATGTSNPDWVTSYSLGLSYSLPAHFSLNFKGAAKTVHFLDGSNGLRTSLAESLGYKFRNYSFYLSYFIGNYDENESAHMFTYDEDRRVVSLGVSIEI